MGSKKVNKKLSTKGMSESEKQVYWSDKLKAFKLSGLSQKKFAETHGISVDTLGEWKKRLELPEKKPVSKNIPIQKTQKDAPVTKVSIAPLELRHRSGFSIVVDESVDEAFLKKVLKSLSDLNGK